MMKHGFHYPGKGPAYTVRIKKSIFWSLIERAFRMHSFKHIITEFFPGQPYPIISKYLPISVLCLQHQTIKLSLSIEPPISVVFPSILSPHKHIAFKKHKEAIKFYIPFSAKDEQSIQIPLHTLRPRALGHRIEQRHRYQKTSSICSFPRRTHCQTVYARREQVIIRILQPYQWLIDADTKSLVITDTWGGHREQALLLYPDKHNISQRKYKYFYTVPIN